MFSEGYIRGRAVLRGAGAGALAEAGAGRGDGQPLLPQRTSGAQQLLEARGCEDDPDNLYAPIHGHNTAKDGFRALSRSLYNWLEKHPTLRRGAAAGTALGLLVALRRRS